MAVIPAHVQEFLPGKLAWVATAAIDGTPNTTPKGSLRVLDDEHLLFADLFTGKTRANLEQNPKVAVTVVDAVSGTGYQFKGTAILLSEGPLYEEVAKALQERFGALPAPRYVVKIAVEAIFDQSAGRRAGERIS